MRDDPGRLGQRQVDRGRCARAPAALVVQIDADTACSLPPRRQPDAQRLHQAPNDCQDDFGLLDTILQIEVADEPIGRDIRRVAQGLPFVSLRERVEQGGAAASAQACARQTPQLAQRDAAHGAQPVKVGACFGKRITRQAIECARQRAGPGGIPQRATRLGQQPGPVCRGSHAAARLYVQGIQIATQEAHQRTHAAEQPQAGRDLKQDRIAQVLCDRGRIAQRRLGGQIQSGALGGFVSRKGEGIGGEAAGAGLAHSDCHTQVRSGGRGGDDHALVQHEGGAPGLSEPPQAPHVQAEAVQVQADPKGHDRDP